MINIKKFKLYFLLLLLLTFENQIVQAKTPTETIQTKRSGPKKQTLNVITNNPEIECTLDLLSKLEARDIFGSTDDINGSPQDIIEKTYYTFYGSTSVASTILTNGFSNLHNRYLIGKITITNKSKNEITITNPLESGEEYLFAEGIELTSPAEILKRFYVKSSLSRKILCGGMAGFFGLIAIGALLDNPEKRNEPPLGIGERVTLSSFFGFLSAVCLYPFKEESRFKQLKADFENERLLLDQEPLNTKGQTEIIIPPNSTFNDFVFFNRANYKNIESRIKTANLELIFEI